MNAKEYKAVIDTLDAKWDSYTKLSAMYDGVYECTLFDSQISPKVRSELRAYTREILRRVKKNSR